MGRTRDWEQETPEESVIVEDMIALLEEHSTILKRITDFRSPLLFD